MRAKWTLLLVMSLFCFSSYALTNENSLHALSQKKGFFFFFSSSCPHCQRFAPVLKHLSQSYGFNVVAISMDGGYLPDFPYAVLDEGQSKLFQVTVFPSLFLIDPQNEQAHLVTEGAIDEMELTNRLLKINQSNGTQVVL
ncbi:conjugal pilus assembly protein TraF [Legionella pneumophila]|uniref:conjugal transfer protein TraF n=1 Tax=Legionella pneumophila TaxID=446 RepID=UPI00077073A1|nr:conjugal transfer protein TraF [Legionella pneumophila]CZP12233.1 conjugal pilus assembly protein TraF [Legionella pneumophila]CZP48334.1 conjugal pilus assembly protein TraF [Legionella pneumophila]CZP78389.1 conjugal pilus assembly protein TraF [Legionella pneumophila]HBD9326056.1 conjugal transfer protein TraF [Legionella pneumophila]